MCERISFKLTSCLTYGCIFNALRSKVNRTKFHREFLDWYTENGLGPKKMIYLTSGNIRWHEGIRDNEVQSQIFEKDKIIIF